MKKLIGFGFILAALAVITFSIIGYPKIDANLWPLLPVVLFAFFTLENALKKDYKSSLICAVIGFILPMPSMIFFRFQMGSWLLLGFWLVLV